MATKKEFNQILKEFSLTTEQFQAIYEDVATTNKLVNNLLNITKIKLQDLPPHLLRQLPTQKEKDLKSIEEKKEKQNKEEQEKIKQQQDKKYYQEHFEEIMVDKIDNKKKLTERELRELVFGYDISTEKGDNRRWSRSVTTIVKLMNRTFAINWEEGLTENQENEFYYQPYEVILKEYEKTITVKEWVKIDDVATG